MENKIYEFLDASNNIKMIISTNQPQQELIQYSQQQGIVTYREYIEKQPTIEEIQASIKRNLTAAVQFHMDQRAREYSYDSIMTACTYASSTNKKFAAEGQAFVQWRDQVWSSCYEILGGVLAGEKSVPETEELLAQLPGFVCPNV